MKQKVLVSFSFLLPLIIITVCGCVASQKAPLNDDGSILLSTALSTPSPTIHPTEIGDLLTPALTIKNTPSLATIAPPPTSTPVTTGTIIVQSEPQGANLDIVDIGFGGQTPFSTTLPTGDYMVTLDLPGYKTWTDTIYVSEAQTTTVQVPLSAYEYIRIEQLDSTHYLTYLDWTPDGQSLVYAIQSDGISTEGKDWIWWQFDLLTREKSSLLPPQSEIIETTRQNLGLCPLATDQSTDVALCPAYSILIESPINDQIVFSPLPYREETWLSNKDGSNSQKLDIPGSPVYVDWSGNGRWLIIGISSFGLPGQRLYFLVSADGVFSERLDQLVGHNSLHVSGLFPKFSPDGTHLAYVGAQTPETYIENDYKLYSLDLNTFESELISDRFGPFQWAENGSGLYILEKGVFPVTDNPLDFDVRDVTLYYVYLDQENLQESELARNILYYPKNSSSAWLWSYSPNSNAIAYVGLQSEEELGILLLNPSE